MAEVQSGWLILADVTGYTMYLTTSELEHAAAILEDLMRVLLAAVQPPLKLVKLEGDAVFFWAPASAVPEGPILLDRLENTYFDFRMHLFNVHRASTCTCTACKNADSLDLKFFVHFGEFITHRLAGFEDLQGTSVIVAHRLMKNEVAARTGLHAYVLASDEARRRLGEETWREHVERYEHIGEVRCGLLDLHAVYDEMRAGDPIEIPPEEEAMAYTYLLPCPPAEAWAWHVDADKRPAWDDMTSWVSEPNAAGRIRKGGQTHCEHGSGDMTMRIVDWRPYRSVTYDNPTSGSGMGWYPASRTRMTFEVEGTGTRVRCQVKLLDHSLRARITLWMMAKMLPRMKAKAAERLIALMAAHREEAARAAIESPKA